MNPETPIMQAIRLAVGGRDDARLFRNNVGLFYTRDGRPIRCGLCAGSSDQVGWRSVVVTPRLVGRRIAVFTALEIKTATGRVDPAQINFIDQVQLAGGIAGVARSPEQAKEILDAF